MATPTVITDPVGATSTTTAVLKGRINPQGNDCSYFFRWGTTTSYGNVTPTVHLGAQTTMQTVQATIGAVTPLVAGTQYHYKLVVNADIPTLRLYMGVHEAAYGQVPLFDFPSGAVRLMMGDLSETDKASRAKTAFQRTPSIAVMPCLKSDWTKTSPNPDGTQYDNAVKHYLDLCDGDGTAGSGTGGGAVTRAIGDPMPWFEVGNEPHEDQECIPRLLRCLAGSYQTIRNSGRMTIMSHITSDENTIINGNAGWKAVINCLNNPNVDVRSPANPNVQPPQGPKVWTPAQRGNANWSMVDGWAIHTYNDNPQQMGNSVQSLRNDLAAAGHGDLPIFLTEAGWPVDTVNPNGIDPQGVPGFTQAGYTPTVQSTKIQACWNDLKARAYGLGLHCWIYFAYNDYNAFNQNNWDNHMGVVEQDMRVGMGNPQAMANIPQGWPRRYDGRAKGANVPGPPVVADAGPPVVVGGPYGIGLAKIRSLPGFVDLTA